MSRARVSAREIVEQYGRDGLLSPPSVASAEFGVFDRVVPWTILLMAAGLVAHEAPALVERVRNSGNEVLAKVLKGDDFPWRSGSG